MNKDEYLSSIKAMYAFRDQTKPYVELVNKTASGTYTDLNQSLVEEFQQKGTEQKQNLEKLKQSLGELQAVLAPDRYQALMSRIQGSIDSTNWMLQECDNFLATPDSSFLDNIFTTMADQQENQKRLDDGLNHLETDFAVMLVGAALRGQLTVEDLEDMANKLDSSMPLQKNIERLAKHIQRRENQRQQGVEENQEDRTQERREEPPQTAVSPATPNPSRPEDLATPDLTFQEKLNKINGDNASQITMEVQQLTIEERLKQIDKRIASYEQKDKLSLKENIALSRLQSQKVQLEAYADTLEKQHAKKSEERKFNKFQQKIEQSMELLQQSQENYNQYASKMVRFFSKRYQEQLSRDIQKLQQKRGTLQKQIKISAIVRFQKQSGKIVRGSKLVGTLQGIQNYRREKVQELIDFKDQVVTEFSNIQSDMHRFTSRRNEISSLRNGTIIRLDDIISLDQYRQQRLQSQMVA